MAKKREITARATQFEAKWIQKTYPVVPQSLPNKEDLKLVKGDDEEVRPKSSNKRGGDDEIKSFRSALENAASLL